MKEIALFSNLPQIEDIVEISKSPNNEKIFQQQNPHYKYLKFIRTRFFLRQLFSIPTVASLVTAFSLYYVFYKNRKQREIMRCLNDPKSNPQKLLYYLQNSDNAEYVTNYHLNQIKSLLEDPNHQLFAINILSVLSITPTSRKVVEKEIFVNLFPKIQNLTFENPNSYETHLSQVYFIDFCCRVIHHNREVLKELNPSDIKYLSEMSIRFKSILSPTSFPVSSLLSHHLSMHQAKIQGEKIEENEKILEYYFNIMNAVRSTFTYNRKSYSENTRRQLIDVENLSKKYPNDFFVAYCDYFFSNVYKNTTYKMIRRTEFDHNQKRIKKKRERAIELLPPQVNWNHVLKRFDFDESMVKSLQSDPKKALTQSVIDPNLTPPLPHSVSPQSHSNPPLFSQLFSRSQIFLDSFKVRIRGLLSPPSSSSLSTPSSSSSSLSSSPSSLEYSSFPPIPKREINSLSQDPNPIFFSWNIFSTQFLSQYLTKTYVNLFQTHRPYQSPPSPELLRKPLIEAIKKDQTKI